MYTHDIGYRGMTNWNEIIYLLNSYVSQWQEHRLTEFVGNCDWGSWEGVTTFWGFNGREACLVLLFCWSFLACFSKMPKFQKRTDHVRSTWKYANVAIIQSYFYGVVLHVWNVAEGHLTSLPWNSGVEESCSALKLMCPSAAVLASCWTPQLASSSSVL